MQFEKQIFHDLQKIFHHGVYFSLGIGSLITYYSSETKQTKPLALGPQAGSQVCTKNGVFYTKLTIIIRNLQSAFRDLQLN